ncbi:MAG: DUF4412 domain-containing protein [Chitinophagales bacterium]
MEIMLKGMMSITMTLIAASLLAFNGMVKQEVKNYNGSGTTLEYTWYFNEKGCRVDIDINGQDGPVKTVFLANASVSSIKMYTVDQKSAEKHVFDIEPVKAPAEVQLLSVRATGEKKTIAGYACEKYEIVTNTAKIETWITQAIAVDWSNYQNLFRSSPEILMMAREGIRGFALESTATNNQNTTTLVKATTATQAASLFDVPADYKPFYTNNK